MKALLDGISSISSDSCAIAVHLVHVWMLTYAVSFMFNLVGQLAKSEKKAGKMCLCKNETFILPDSYWSYYFNQLQSNNASKKHSQAIKNVNFVHTFWKCYHVNNIFQLFSLNICLQCYTCQPMSQGSNSTHFAQYRLALKEYINQLWKFVTFNRKKLCIVFLVFKS